MTYKPRLRLILLIFKLMKLEFHVKSIFNRKILFLGFFLFVSYLLLAINDVVDDLHEHIPKSHIAWNITFIFIAVFALFFYLSIAFRDIKKGIDNKNQITQNAIERSEKLEIELSALKNGMTQNITSYFNDWKFTEAEIEIGFLIIKGFSFKEISRIRKTSERTARDQAANIYKKSGMHNRSEFVAFFLEDLLQ